MTPVSSGGQSVSAAGPQDQTQDDATIIGHAAEDCTPLARLKALAALRGMVVIDLADGALLVTRWGHTRAVPDACVLAQFLRQMGVQI